MRVPHTTRTEINRDQSVVDPMFDPVYHATRVIIGFLQGLFKSLPAGRYTWSPDPEKTEITITDALPITQQALTLRPCIVTVRGQSAYANTTLNSLVEIDHKTGLRTFRDVISSSVTVNCISRNGVESSRLAWFVASHVKALRHVLQRSGPFVAIGQDVNVMGELPPTGLVQDSADSAAINVPLVLPFMLAHNWEVREPSFLAGKISVNIDGDVEQSVIEEVENG